MIKWHFVTSQSFNAPRRISFFQLFLWLSFLFCVLKLVWYSSIISRHPSLLQQTVVNYTCTIQLFRENLSEKMPKRQSRNVIWDMINQERMRLHCSWHCSCRTYFCRFPLVLANMCPWPLFCHSFKFLWRRVNSKPHTIRFRIVACTFWNNLSRNSCIFISGGNIVYGYKNRFCGHPLIIDKFKEGWPHDFAEIKKRISG